MCGWTREDTQDYSEEAYGDRDSGKEVSRAEHQARNDAVGSDFEVRESKEETNSSSRDSSSNDSSSSDSGSESQTQQ
ncbi:MAG: hypothetical protein WAX66_02200 [Patescibacteria group bacterium]